VSTPQPSDTASAPPRLLVLWDVDHTLIETRGVGRAIYESAFPAATGRPLAKLAQISGRTELDIMSESLRVNGIEPTDEAVSALGQALIQGYEDARQELGRTGRALPGAHDTLTAVADNSSIYQSVLTGNLRDVARIKLEVFGLDSLLDLESGAYGDDNPERPKLVAIAQQRATERTGVTFDNNHTVLVGDTPKDVEAALTAGVRVIGVATGKTTVKELRAAGAETVLGGLEAQAMLDALDQPN
jgi:phosphoglycolate phosphatase